MTDVVITKELLRDEALTILRSVRENTEAGRSNRLADVKGALESRTTVDFDDYFLFLRKHNYMVLDRERGALEVTAEGKEVVEKDPQKLLSAVESFFAGRLGDEVATPFETEKTQTLTQELKPVEMKAVPPPLPLDIEIRVEPKGKPPTSAPPPVPPQAAEDAKADRDAKTRVPVAQPMQLGASPAPSAAARNPFDQHPAPKPTTREVPRAEPRAADMKATEAAPARTETRGDAHASPPSKDGQRGTDIDLRYTKFEALGGGALGTVFKGKHASLGVEVAIKELRDIFGYFSFLQRGEVIKKLKKEIAAQAQLRHPSVIAISDQSMEVAKPYYVMELASGGNLRQKLDALAGKGLPVSLALRYFLQIAYGLRAGHQAGLMHQNLKPENILIDGLGNVKLSDFGLTRVIDTESVPKQMPQVFLGTGGMGYMPPELLASKKEFGPDGDLYMLGLVLYEMLTGGLPGRRSPLPSTANPEAPMKLDPIFDKLTQDRRDARYATVDAMLEDFYSAFSDGSYMNKGDLLLFAIAPDAPAPVVAPAVAAVDEKAKA